MRLWLVRSHLADELLENRVGEGLVALSRDDEGARTADHVVQVIVIETGFQGQDRQAVDDNAGTYRGVAGARSGPAPVVGAVAGNVDNATCPLERTLQHQWHSIVDDATDRGTAAEEPMRCGGNRVGKGLRCRRIVDQGPRQYLELQSRAGPLHHGDCNRLRDARLDRL